MALLGIFLNRLLSYYFIRHLEALCGKSLKTSGVMDTAVKCVNKMGQKNFVTGSSKKIVVRN
jgi:hypothetical protein